MVMMAQLAVAGAAGDSAAPGAAELVAVEEAAGGSWRIAQPQLAGAAAGGR